MFARRVMAPRATVPKRSHYFSIADTASAATRDADVAAICQMTDS